MNSILNNANTRLNSVLSNTAAPGAQVSSGALPFVFGGIVVIFLLIAIFYKQIMYGLHYTYDSIRQFFGAEDKQGIRKPNDETPVVAPPELPQNAMADDTLIEKVLPGRKEVFNISQNRYTYYDAEPLCKALGAELATYDQVKEAWDKGGDWCNYGWVKGQVAVYPTQAETWEKLQKGPEEQRGACGRPGVNGGHFDNPELRFGVSCYGVKPAQSTHDANMIAKRDGEPLTPGAIEFDKKVAHYRSEADHIGIMPFNNSTWDSP